MISCYLCEKTEFVQCIPVRDYISGELFEVGTCASCRLVSTLGLPEASELSKYYGQAYYGNRKSFFDYIINKTRVKRILRLKKSGTLLDVGCGKGDFLLALHAHGWQVFGTEFSTLYDYSVLEKMIQTKICIADIAQCNFPEKNFDIVTLWHVFEHLTEPRRYLSHIAQLLHPHGYLIIEVPNFDSWQAHFGGNDCFHVDAPRHTMHLTPETLTKFLTQAGFIVVGISHVSFFYDVFGTIQTILNKFTKRKNLLFDVLGNRVRWQDNVIDTIVTIILSPFLFIFALILYPLAVFAQKGGIITLYAGLPR